MEILIGAGLAIGVSLAAGAAGFERERAFYPVALAVIGGLYDLFAVIGGSMSALGAETLGLIAFFSLAAVGYRTSLWLVAAGLVAHGLFDLVHPHLIDNPGVPRWWPGFCMAYDVVAGAILAVALASGRLAARRTPSAP